MLGWRGPETRGARPLSPRHARDEPAEQSEGGREPPRRGRSLIQLRKPARLGRGLGAQRAQRTARGSSIASKGSARTMASP